MTALILYENNELNELISINYPDSYNFEGKVAYLTAGDKISVEQLLEFLLVYSANDSAYATAMHISNSVDEFVKLMNTRAKKLNMVNTNFQNPDGLDQENHYTTINDLLLMSEYILRNTKLIDITNKSNFYYEQNGEVKKYENTNIRINSAGCLDFCEQGPTVVVYPESIWYSKGYKKSICYWTRTQEYCD